MRSVDCDVPGRAVLGAGVCSEENLLLPDNGCTASLACVDRGRVVVADGYRFESESLVPGVYRRWLAAVLVLLMAVSACSSTESEPTVPTLPATTQPQPIPPATTAATTASTEPSDASIRLRTGDDFQAVVEAAEEGTTFVVDPGVHRLHEIHPKDDMTFEGMPGSVLSGAVQLTEWVEDSTGIWRHDGLTVTAQEHGVCVEGYDGCSLSQDLFMDDVMLWQVTNSTDLEPGSWLWEGESIYVADNPTTRRVELSIASHAFQSDADNVTIRGLVIEKYATPAQSGAIQSGYFDSDDVGSGWRIEDSEVRLNHGAGIRSGQRTILRRVFVHSNGQLGIAFSGGSGGLIEDCEIANNNVAGFDWGWEAGGAKFTVTSGLVVRGTWSHDNNGPGLWTDISNHDTLYEDNLVVDNTGPGIFHEISYSAVIRNNTVTGNGHESSEWLWGSGILVAASTDVEIHDNTVTGNADGIGGIQQARDDGPEGPYLLANMFVHDNTISVERGHIGVVEDVGDRAVFTDRNNRFESNTYVDTDGHRYYWRGRTLDAAGWMEAGQDIEGEWR